MNEWIPIRDTDNKYFVNKQGQILSANPNKGFLKKQPLILNGSKDKDGYLRVDIRQDGVIKTVKVHRIVAETFIPNPQNKPTVNHIDGNKLNNSVENLEWCTNKENILHSYNSGLRPNSHLGFDVTIYCENGEIKTFKSMKECSTYLNHSKAYLVEKKKKYGNEFYIGKDLVKIGEQNNKLCRKLCDMRK